MRKFLVLLLVFSFAFASVCMAEGEDCTSYREYTYVKGEHEIFNYSVPENLLFADANNGTILDHYIDATHFIRVMGSGVAYAPLETEEEFISYCKSYVSAVDYAEVVVTIFCAPETYQKAALAYFDDEYTFIVASENGIASFQTKGYSSSREIQAAFMQMISSVTHLYVAN